MPETLEKPPINPEAKRAIASGYTHSGFTRPPHIPSKLSTRVHKLAPLAVIALSLAGILYLVERIHSPRTAIADPTIQAITFCDGSLQETPPESALGLSALDVDMDESHRTQQQAQVHSSLMHNGAYPPDATADMIAYDRAVRSYLESLRVTGVRDAQENSRIMIGDHIYTLNSIITQPYPLRLTRITPTELTFIDDRGIEYQKPI